MHQNSSGPVLSTDHSSNMNNYAHIWKKYGHIWYLLALFPLCNFPGITQQGLAHQTEVSISVTPLAVIICKQQRQQLTEHTSSEFVLPICYLGLLYMLLPSSAFFLCTSVSDLGVFQVESSQGREISSWVAYAHCIPATGGVREEFPKCTGWWKVQHCFANIVSVLWTKRHWSPIESEHYTWPYLTAWWHCTLLRATLVSATDAAWHVCELWCRAVVFAMHAVERGCVPAWRMAGHGEGYNSYVS